MNVKTKKYLDKVVEQLVSETNITGGVALVPFFISPLPSSSLFRLFSSIFPPNFSFSNYVTKIYGLNEQEIEYVWKQYKDIINNRI